MEADYILLCNGIKIKKEQKKIDGGVVIKGQRIIKIGSRDEIYEYIGIETRIIDFYKSNLVAFRTESETGDDYNIANIAIFKQSRRNPEQPITKSVNLCFLMYYGEIIYERESTI